MITTPSLRGVKTTKQSITPSRLLRSLWSITICVLLILPTTPLQARDYCDHADNAAEFRECGDIYYQMEDKAMTIIYQKLIKLLKAEDVDHMINNMSREEHLRKSQRAWIKFRDENCDAYSTIIGYGGTIMMDLYQGCITSMTKERALELNSLYDSAKGN